jgi:hypothetical protein
MSPEPYPALAETRTSADFTHDEGGQSVSASINAADLTPDQRKALGLSTARKGQFSKEEVRLWALIILASMSALSEGERDRVLKYAQSVNFI